tara:strand:+ start:577 stop:741 length:165 start_codon:yes stop_codon:yes gene_type:complete
MAKKGTPKNTKNKAKHTKLMNRKKNKVRKEKDAHSEKIKAILQQSKLNKKSEES